MPDEARKDAVETKEKNKPNKKSLIVVIIAIIVLVVGAGAFAVLHFKKGRVLNRGFRGGYGMMGGNFRGGMMGRGGFRGGNFNNGNGYIGSNGISGKVTAVNDKTFTVDANGTSKNVQITDSTRFPANSSSQVKVGDQVVVIGEQDSNGNIQATRVIDRTNVQTQSDTQTPDPIQNPSEAPLSN